MTDAQRFAVVRTLGQRRLPLPMSLECVTGVPGMNRAEAGGLGAKPPE